MGFVFEAPREIAHQVVNQLRQLLGTTLYYCRQKCDPFTQI